MKNLPKKRDNYNFECALIGDKGVGKTAILWRFVDRKFSDITKETNYKHDRKEFRFGNKYIRLRIWDSPNYNIDDSFPLDEDFTFAFIIFDKSRKETFENLENHIKRFNQSDNRLIYLIGNKSDKEIKISTDEAQECAISNNIQYFEVSAKSNENID